MNTSKFLALLCAHRHEVRHRGGDGRYYLRCTACDRRRLHPMQPDGPFRPQSRLEPVPPPAETGIAREAREAEAEAANVTAVLHSIERGTRVMEISARVRSRWESGGRRL